METLPEELRIRTFRDTLYPYPQLSREFISERSYREHYSDIPITHKEIERVIKGKVFAVTNFTVGFDGRDCFASSIHSPSFVYGSMLSEYIELNWDDDVLSFTRDLKAHGNSLVGKKFEGDLKAFSPLEFDLVAIYNVLKKRKSLGKDYVRKALKKILNEKIEELTSHEYYREVLEIWLVAQCTMIGIPHRSHLVDEDEWDDVLPGELSSTAGNEILIKEIEKWINSL
jgi:hypothetical protein